MRLPQLPILWLFSSPKHKTLFSKVHFREDDMRKTRELRKFSLSLVHEPKTVWYFLPTPTLDVVVLYTT